MADLGVTNGIDMGDGLPQMHADGTLKVQPVLTTDVPTEDGWYWALIKNDKYPMPVELRHSEGYDEPYVRMPGAVVGMRPKMFTHWSGRLEPPAVPE